MQFSNYDFIDSKSFAGKIILTSFPGLNSNGLFEEKILKQILKKDELKKSCKIYIEYSKFVDLELPKSVNVIKQKKLGDVKALLIEI